MLKTSVIQTLFFKPHRYTFREAIAVFIGCGLAYALILELFLLIPGFNVGAQVRPVSGVSPVLGLFFGVPGILGCSVANLLIDLVQENNVLLAIQWFIPQVIYNGFIYVAWYLVFRNSKRPYARLESSLKVAIFIGLALLDSILVSMLLAPFESEAISSSFDVNTVHTLNNIVFLTYVGIPLLVLLDHVKLRAQSPWWIKVPYEQYQHMYLSQRFVVIFTFAAAIWVNIAIGFGYSGYFISDDVDLSQLIPAIYTFEVIVSILFLGPMLGLLHFLETRVTRPLEVLTKASRSFIEQIERYQNNPETTLTVELDESHIIPRMEVRELFDTTNKMRSDLVNYLEEISTITAEKQRTAAELDIARNIQQSAVPHDFARFSDLYHVHVESYMRPAREVGGDFYDVFELDEHRVAFVIGDVSGKGVPASLFMMRAQSLLRQYIMTEEDLGKAFALANKELCERNDAMLFVTAFACILDVETGNVTYQNAGHNPPSIEKDNNRAFLSCRAGLVLGAMDGVRYHSAEFMLGEQGNVVLYTDGVTEAGNVHDELFGEERLDRALRENPEMNQLDNVVSAVDSFAGEAPQADDITLLSFTLLKKDSY